MKVVFLNAYDGQGGAAGIATQLGHRLRERGHEVLMLVGRKSSQLDWVQELPGWGDGTAVERVGRRLLGLVKRVPAEGAETRRVWRRLVQSLVLRSQWNQWRGADDFAYPPAQRVWERLPFQPDVIHAHNLHAYNGWTHFDLRLLPALSRRAAWIFTLHDAWLLTGHCAHFFACQRWTHGCGECPSLTSFPPVRRDRTAQNWAARAQLYAQSRYHVVGVSHWVRDQALRSPLARGVVSEQVIPNGIDLRFFAPLADRTAVRARWGVAPEARVLAYVSELGKKSPFRDFSLVERLCASPHLRAHGPVTVLEIGGEASDRQVSPHLRIIGTGYVRERPVLRDLIGCADVLVHPAIIDTLPTVVLEAMGCGVPVVATAVGGLPDQVVPGETGYLVPAGDAEAAAQRVGEILSSPDLAAHLARGARARAEAVFPEEKMYRAYESLYQRACAP